MSALLRQEARAVAQLDHENIVRIFDVAEWSGAPWEPKVPFLIMECLEGECLSAVLQRENTEEALRQSEAQYTSCEFWRLDRKAVVPAAKEIHGAWRK